MPTRIIEYNVPASSGLLDQRTGRTVVPAEYKIAKQVAFTASTSPTTSATFNALTNLVVVQSDEQVYVDVAASPSVNTNDYRIPAGNEQWFSCTQGASYAAQVRT